MTFIMIIQDCEGQISDFFLQICIFYLTCDIWPPGVPMYGLTPWSDGIFFEEQLIRFNFSMTYVMIIQDCRGQISDFLSIYSYFT